MENVKVFRISQSDIQEVITGLHEMIIRVRPELRQGKSDMSTSRRRRQQRVIQSRKSERMRYKDREVDWHPSEMEMISRNQKDSPEPQTS
jgi:hypothetical protein